tara:strand:- start:11 stop:448 length:438 start_codon:yes stop_codon:yes gene_type:complete
MAVTYKNNWKNILNALSSKIKAEMKCPVYSDFYDVTKSNHFIKLIPQGSEQGDVTVNSEHRTFLIDLNYYIAKQSNKKFQEYIFNQVSIVEALVHDNPTISLADGTKAYNLQIGDLDLDIEPEDGLEEYFVAGWNMSIEHLSNLG